MKIHNQYAIIIMQVCKSWLNVRSDLLNSQAESYLFYALNAFILKIQTTLDIGFHFKV